MFRRIFLCLCCVALGLSFGAWSFSRPATGTTAGPGQTPFPVAGLWGDANCDGNTDISDPMAILQYLFASEPIPAACAQGGAVDVVVTSPVDVNVLSAPLKPGEDPDKFRSIQFSTTVTGVPGSGAEATLVSIPSGIGGFVVTQVEVFANSVHAFQLEDNAGNVRVKWQEYLVNVNVPRTGNYTPGLTFAAGDSVRLVAPAAGPGDTIELDVFLVGYEY